MSQKTELVPLPVGAMLDGKYQVVKRLGEPSGFGIAYLCKDRNLDIEVVIKEFAPSSMAFRESGYVIQPDHKQKDAFLEFLNRFVEEAKLLAKVSETLLHPNIVRVLNAFQGNGTAYFVMSYLEGETFMQKMEREGRLEPIFTMKRLLPILDALHQLHHYGKKGETTVILHRDLKPDNLFLTKRGLPVLIDFGLAKELEKSSDYMNYGLGAKGFGSPEQLNGRKVGRIGEWTDVYGIVGSLFHLVTGIPPNLDAADDFLEKRALHPKPEISAALKAMFTKGLAFSPKDRTQNIVTLRAEWEAIIAPEAALKPAPAPTPRPNVIVPPQVPKPAPKISVPPAPRIITPQTPKHGDTRTDFGIEMVFIQAGNFIMGDDNGYPDETPAHRVEIKEGFWMGKYPVTQGQFEKIMGNNPSFFKGENYPVEEVSWLDAMKFCTKLNEKVGKKQYRLPTEEEWEYACRAGTMTKWSFGNNKTKLWDYAWFDGNSGGQTHEVGGKCPNGWGLYDMHGNVWELCYSKWTKNYAGARTVIIPSRILEENTISYNESHVLRGGSWCRGAGILRSARRGYSTRIFRLGSDGFRLFSTL